jgi:hypothetical protein
MLNAQDPDEHLVEVPLVARSGADNRQSARRISCTSAAPSRRRRRCRAQPEAAQHRAG